MPLVEINRNPTDRQLREFAVIALVALPLVGWLWGAPLGMMIGLAVGGLVLALLGAALPRALKPIFLLLSFVAAPIGMALGEVAMLLLYFGLLLPTGLMFRLLGRDVLQRSFDRASPSYWQTKAPPRDAAGYYRQS